jgi:hypothetical protein
MSRRWLIWGTIATLLPLANLYFMGVQTLGFAARLWAARARLLRDSRQ